MGFGPLCLGLSASPLSLLFHTAFASLLVLSSRGVFRRFPYVFCFWLVCVSLSWFISVFVSFVFRFHTPFLWGCLFSCYARKVFKQRPFSHVGGSFVSLACYCAPMGVGRYHLLSFSRCFAPFYLAAHLLS